MTEIRALFLEAVDATTPLLAEPALAERFDGPSALAEFTVRGLAGHLLRALTSVDGYLDGPEPDAGPGAAIEAISAPAYYASVAAGGADIDSDLNRAIRRRGVEAASGSPTELAGGGTEVADRPRARLAAEGAGPLARGDGDLL